MKNLLGALLLCVFLASCEEPVPEGRIRVKNDSQDLTFNILEVHAGGSSFTLKPGEKTLLPKGVTYITFRREYRDFTREYLVQCPLQQEKGISIKLIDVHVNRIAGGCQTVSATKK